MNALAPAQPPVSRHLRAAHHVDFDYLEHVAGGDGTYVVLMARMFCAHFPQEMFLAEVAATRADVPALRQELLRLGVTCQQMGLPRLTLLAHQLAAVLDTTAVWPEQTSLLLRRLRHGGFAAINSLPLRLQARYPQALAQLLPRD
jgi:hypothetical protein